jgi:hypothetical protein
MYCTSFLKKLLNNIKFFYNYSIISRQSLSVATAFNSKQQSTPQGFIATTIHIFIITLVCRHVHWIVNKEYNCNTLMRLEEQKKCQAN